MAHIQRAMNLACISVCNLTKAGKGRKALCAALEIFRKVEPQDLSVDHKRTFVKVIASAEVALDRNMLNLELNKGDIKSLTISFTISTHCCWVAYQDGLVRSSSSKGKIYAAAIVH
jgi:hypothetical protein